MDSAGFKRWRKSLDLSQKEAAKVLGLKRRIVQYYEKGERDGKPVEVPKSVSLACYALSIGIEGYEGPPAEEPAETAPEAKAKAEKKPRKSKKAIKAETVPADPPTDPSGAARSPTDSPVADAAEQAAE